LDGPVLIPPIHAGRLPFGAAYRGQLEPVSHTGLSAGMEYMAPAVIFIASAFVLSAFYRRLKKHDWEQL
jgi:hypothetical protein